MRLPKTHSYLEHQFPKLLPTGYEIKEPPLPLYNCVALVSGKTWWVNPSKTTEGLIRYFKHWGWRVCNTGEIEDGLIKLCIYVDLFNVWTHTCLQTREGKWLSKLGDGALIEHNAADALEGFDPAYGQCKYFMQ